MHNIVYIYRKIISIPNPCFHGKKPSRRDFPLKAALNGGSGFNGSPRDFLAAGRLVG